MKAYLIDAAAREVRAVEYAGLPDLQKMVGGYITTACGFVDGGCLFVDDEGLFKPQEHFFRISLRPDQPLAGNGVVVGRETYDDDGEYIGTNDPTMTLTELAAMVEFRNRAQVDAWAKANASEPASSITMLHADGTAERHVTGRYVTGRYGELIGRMPRPTGGE
jgi:hypothetical protein